MSSKRVWQGNWEGRESTEWTGSIKSLRAKIPTFTQNIFHIGKGHNKYKDLIVREPLCDADVGADLGMSHVEFDLGYVEAATRERIPIEAVSNGHRAGLFRGRKQGYKLVEHHTVVDDVLEVLNKYIPPESVRIPYLKSLQGTLGLSIYGARMYISIFLPDYKRGDCTLKIHCRNSVDRKYALTIHLSICPVGTTMDIPLDGFHHPHTQELKDRAIQDFLYGGFKYFFYGAWQTDEADRDVVEEIIRKGLTHRQGKLVLSRVDAEKQERVNLLRFRQILSELFNEGRDIFRSGEHAVRLANLTSALNQLADEYSAETLTLLSQTGRL